jgi:hypothetical protein
VKGRPGIEWRGSPDTQHDAARHLAIAVIFAVFAVPC